MPVRAPDPRAAASGGRRHLAACGAIATLAFALCLAGLGTEVLRHPLEAKYALAAREMLRGGSLLVAHVFGELWKRGAYLLPLYPATALMVGWLWDRTLAGATRTR